MFKHILFIKYINITACKSGNENFTQRCKYATSVDNFTTKATTVEFLRTTAEFMKKYFPNLFTPLVLTELY